MLTKRFFCLTATVILCMLPMLTDSFLAAQDSLTVFSDTTSVLNTAPDTLSSMSAADNWTDDDLPDWSQPFMSDTVQALLSFFTGMMGVTGILAVFIFLMFVFFPLIAIIAIIVLIYKLNREKEKNHNPAWQQPASTHPHTVSRQYLKDQAINRFMWAVALLLLYWLLEWTILGIAGIILLCIAGSQLWRFKSGQKDSYRHNDISDNHQDE